MAEWTDLVIEPGRRITITVPAGENEAFGPEPFAAGQYFTLRAPGGPWRCKLLGSQAAEGGASVLLDLEVEGPYAATPAP